MVIKPSELSENMASLLATLIPQYLDKVRHRELSGRQALGARDGDCCGQRPSPGGGGTTGLGHWGAEPWAMCVRGRGCPGGGGLGSFLSLAFLPLGRICTR